MSIGQKIQIQTEWLSDWVSPALNVTILWSRLKTCQLRLWQPHFESKTGHRQSTLKRTNKERKIEDMMLQLKEHKWIHFCASRMWYKLTCPDTPWKEHLDSLIDFPLRIKRRSKSSLCAGSALCNPGQVTSNLPLQHPFCKSRPKHWSVYLDFNRWIARSEAFMLYQVPNWKRDKKWMNLLPHLPQQSQDKHRFWLDLTGMNRACPSHAMHLESQGK